MNYNNYRHTAWNTPFIAQRADPYVKLIDGKWYLTASVPAYDGIVLRCADSLEGLRTASGKEHCWRIRPWALRCKDEDPIHGTWEECGMMQRTDDDYFSFTAFSLDMTVFELHGKRYCIWAETVCVDPMISNLYIAEWKRL